MHTENVPNADRRNVLKLTLLARLTGMLPATASAQQEETFQPPARAMPTVDTRFPAEIAQGVFIVPDKRILLVPNIGIIVGTESVLVVDCGLGLDSAENVLRLAARARAGTPDYPCSDPRPSGTRLRRPSVQKRRPHLLQWRTVGLSTGRTEGCSLGPFCVLICVPN